MGTVLKDTPGLTNLSQGECVFSGQFRQSRVAPGSGCAGFVPPFAFPAPATRPGALLPPDSSHRPQQRAACYHSSTLRHTSVVFTVRNPCRARANGSGIQSDGALKAAQKQEFFLCFIQASFCPPLG